MNDIDKKSFQKGLVFFFLLLAAWANALFFAPVDEAQGEIYRILFLHVPSAFTTFTAALILCIYCIRAMKNNSENHLRSARAAAEIGLMFTVLTLATGSIWGKPTWGTWWTWDARLTTTFILAILYCAFLILHGSMAAGASRIKSCGILGILIFADVPIIYKSVEIWRTLHQPPTLLREGGSSMSPDMLRVLMFAIAATLCMAAWLLKARAKNLEIKDEIDQLSYDQLT